jgi:hypothetical protein
MFFEAIIFVPFKEVYNRRRIYNHNPFLSLLRPFFASSSQTALNRFGLFQSF